MKKVLCLIIILFTFSLLTSCASQTRYIEIKEDDVIYERGIGKFEVQPGDTLKIVKIKRCRGGSGICYKVIKLQTGEFGYISKKRIAAKHRMYTQETAEGERKYIEIVVTEGQKDSAPAETKHVVDVNPKEPWTGTWNATDGRWGDFVLKLKQSGSEVKSIKGSDRYLKAKVKGDRLKGWYHGVYKTNFDIKISDDLRSFKGKAFMKETYNLKGVRQE